MVGPTSRLPSTPTEEPYPSYAISASDNSLRPPASRHTRSQTVMLAGNSPSPSDHRTSSVVGLSRPPLQPFLRFAHLRFQVLPALALRSQRVVLLRLTRRQPLSTLNWTALHLRRCYIPRHRAPKTKLQPSRLGTSTTRRYSLRWTWEQAQCATTTVHGTNAPNRRHT